MLLLIYENNYLIIILMIKGVQIYKIMIINEHRYLIIYIFLLHYNIHRINLNFHHN